MKGIGFIFSLFPLFAFSSFGQGMASFTTGGSGQYIRIETPDGPVLIGANSGAVSLGAGPGQVNFRLYVQTNGVPVSFNADGTPVNMVLAGTATNYGSTMFAAQGGFNGGNPFYLPAPFDGSFDIEFYFWAETQNGLFSGHSGLAMGYTPTSHPAPPHPMFGINSWQVQGFTLTAVPNVAPVPEPSLLALAALGGSALLWRRRRRR